MEKEELDKLEEWMFRGSNLTDEQEAILAVKVKEELRSGLSLLGPFKKGIRLTAVNL